MADFEAIERKWQKEWEKAGLGCAEVSKKPKFFMVFAYPGISGYLHVGHMRGFSYTDMICRYKRMMGFNVLFPVGTHASGNQVIAFAKKIAGRDKKWISYLKENGCPDLLIPKMANPEFVVDYFNKVYINDYWKRFGFIADYNRFICTIFPDYNQFIKWQFRKLAANNLLVQKPYFATFCPECGPVAIDPSETDISKGGNAEKQEFTLLKFKFGDAYIIAASLRPDTVFGQTNLWVDPKMVYAKAEVDGELWILSKEAAEKLSYQKGSVKVVGEIKGSSLIGKYVSAPGAERDIIILPCSFCDASIGSGIVTSVPSDAPWDFIALKDLQNNKSECEKYHLDFAEVRAIKPIPIIKCAGFGAMAAVELCEKHNVKSQKDVELLETLTKEVYKQSHHTGVLTANCGKFQGKRVEDAKELIKQELIESKKADVMHDLSEEVVCRCGAKVIIKKINDQWFIKYSDNELTEKSKEHAKGMQVYPEEYHKNLPAVLDWFMDRACARLGNWLGTKLPFDAHWTIEPISDSTLYPAYYTVSKYVNSRMIKPEQLSEAFFDFIFLGKGRAEEVAKETNLSPKLIRNIKKEFNYWYPLDINLGGKEHQTVHFPVFIMNHVGILDKKFWPRGIFVNHWVVGKGSKISKSKGGAIPIPGAIKRFSVDGMRLYYAHIGNHHTDIEWSDEIVFSYKSAVERVFGLCESLFFCSKKKSSLLDKWLVSKVNDILSGVSSAMESLDFREATNLVYFSLYDLLKWYERRGGCNKAVLKSVLEIFAKMAALFTPHMAEDLWHKLGYKSLVSAEAWPIFDEKKIDLDVEAMEGIIESLITDMRSVLKLSKIKEPKKAILFIAPDWKFSLCREVKKQLGATKNIGEIIKELMKDEDIRENAKDVARLVTFFVKSPEKLPFVVSGSDKEFGYLKSSADFLKQEFGFEVNIVKAEESSDEKANHALPGKPAILVS